MAKSGSISLKGSAFCRRLLFAAQRFAVNADDLFVGDTEDDIVSGNDLGCKVYFVLSGIRGRWLTQKLNLDVNVIQNISELK